MTIRDKNNLLSEEERQSYHRLLTIHGYELHHFFLEVLEDQTPMDMNDMSYVVIIKTKATHLKHEKSKTYVSRAGSGTWLSEFEEDLKKGCFLGG